MCMKEGEEENELKENKQIKYLSKHCLFGGTKHLSFSTTIYIMRSEDHKNGILNDETAK